MTFFACKVKQNISIVINYLI